MQRFLRKTRARVVCVAFLLVIGMSLLSSVGVSTVSADENYYDHSSEYSDGPGDAHVDGSLREEPRTRLKEA